MEATINGLYEQAKIFEEFLKAWEKVSVKLLQSGSRQILSFMKLNHRFEFVDVGKSELFETLKMVGAFDLRNRSGARCGKKQNNQTLYGPSHFIILKSCTVAEYSRSFQ